MQMRLRALQILVPLLLAGLWGAGLGVMHLRGDMWFVSRVEATMTDVRMLLRGHRRAPDLVTIVAIDDELVRRESSFPVSRATIAAIVDAISEFGPKAIAIDLLLVDPGPAEGDRALASSLGKSRAVLAAAAVFSGSTQQLNAGNGALSDIPVANHFLRPLQEFADVAAIGVVNVETDQAGTPRLIPMVFTDGDRIETSFPLRAVALASGDDPQIEPDGVSVGGRSIRTDLGHALPVAFYGPRGSIRTVSAASVLNGTTARDDIRGRIVVIGATATGVGDVYPSPFDPVLPGVEVMATGISHLASGDGMLRDRSVRLADAGIATLLPMLLVGLLAWRRGAGAFVAIVAVVITWAALNVIIFGNGIWLSAALPMTAAGPPAILFGAVQLWIDRRRARRFASQSELLQHVQAPGLGTWLAENPDFLSEPVRQDAAIVFIDISGFTGLSERLGPNAVRELLNDFYRLVDEQVNASGGAITSFMGDGAMVLFGLPQSTRRRRLQCRRLLRRAQPPDHSLAGCIAGVDKVADRLQDRRAFRRHRRVAARRQEPADRHHWRHRQCGKPANGSGRRPPRRASRQRRHAENERARLRALQGRGAQRTDRGTTSRALRVATGLAVAGAAGTIGLSCQRYHVD